MAGRITGLISLIFLSKITYSSCCESSRRSGHPTGLFHIIRTLGAAAVQSRSPRGRRTMWAISSCAVAIAQCLRCTRATSSSTPDSSPRAPKNPKTTSQLEMFCAFFHVKFFTGCVVIVRNPKTSPTLPLFLSSALIVLHNLHGKTTSCKTGRAASSAQKKTPRRRSPPTPSFHGKAL